MFSPIGNLPPSVYWRRRLLVVGGAVVVVLLLVLTIQVVSGGGSNKQSAAGVSSSSSPAPTTPPASGSSTAPETSPETSQGTSTSASPSQSSGAAGSSNPAVPAHCTARDLAVQAAVGKKTYKVGEKPVVSLQVTNVSARPCVQDLADKQIVLRLYNGQSRVWGSHDCETQPGTSEHTLPVNQPVRVSITWSGSTSQAGCKGPRQRVGAGTYTLYASLAGKAGKAASFTIS